MPTPERDPDPILAIIEEHLKATGKAPAVFGQEVVGDPNLVRDLKAGREPRRPTRQKIMQAIQQPVSA